MKAKKFEQQFNDGVDLTVSLDLSKARRVTFNEGLSAYNLPAASNASSAVVVAANLAVIKGMITPAASGTVIARFASSVLSSAIVAKAGQSYVEYSTY